MTEALLPRYPGAPDFVKHLIERSDQERTKIIESTENPAQTLSGILIFTQRLGIDPAFYREVWRRILRDPHLDKRVHDLLVIILAEWRKQRPILLEEITDSSGASPDVLRARRRKYLSHITKMEEDHEDARKKTISTPISGLSLDEGDQVTAEHAPPSGPSSSGWPGALPETIDWTLTFNRLWNQAAGRAPTSQLPESPAEDRLHEVVAHWVTTREVPVWWFLSLPERRQIDLLKATYSFSYTKKDIKKLQTLLRGNFPPAESTTVLIDGAWGLLDLGFPSAALLLAESGLQGEFGNEDRLRELHQVAWVALFDLRRSPRRALEHAEAYTKFREEQNNSKGMVIGCLGQATIRLVLMTPRAHDRADDVLERIQRQIASMDSPWLQFDCAFQAVVELVRLGDVRRAAPFHTLAVDATGQMDMDEFIAAQRWLQKFVNPHLMS